MKRFGRLCLKIIYFGTFLHCVAAVAGTAVPNEGRLLLILNAPNGGLADQVFDLEKKKAIDLYVKAGFKFVELTNNEISKTNILKAVNQKNLVEFHVLMLTHGNTDSNHEFLLYTGHYDEKSHEEVTISGFDLKQVFQHIIAVHPGVRIYVPSSTCHAGALGDELADVPGVLSLSSGGADSDVITVRKSERDNGTVELHNPVVSMFTTLDKHGDYSTATAKAWQDQLQGLLQADTALYIANSRASGDLKELPLLRTGPELFLETWCAADQKESWAEDQFCLTESNNPPVPEPLKIGAIEQTVSTTHSRLHELELLRALLKCSEPTLTDKSDLDALSSVALFKRGLTWLKERAQTLPEPKKTNYEKSIFFIENYCLSHPDLIEKPSSNLNCDLYSIFSSSIKIDFPKINLTPSADVLSNFSSTHLLGATLTKDTFQKYEKAYALDMKSILDKWPLYAGGMIADPQIPDLKDYCGAVEGSIKQYQADLSCEDRFKSKATVNAWSRYLDLLNLSQRTLISEGKQ